MIFFLQRYLAYYKKYLRKKNNIKFDYNVQIFHYFYLEVLAIKKKSYFIHLMLKEKKTLMVF